MSSPRESLPNFALNCLQPTFPTFGCCCLDLFLFRLSFFEALKSFRFYFVHPFCLYIRETILSNVLLSCGYCKKSGQKSPWYPKISLSLSVDAAIPRATRQLVYQIYLLKRHRPQYGCPFQLWQIYCCIQALILIFNSYVVKVSGAAPHTSLENICSQLRLLTQLWVACERWSEINAEGEVRKK